MKPRRLESAWLIDYANGTQIQQDLLRARIRPEGQSVDRLSEDGGRAGAFPLWDLTIDDLETFGFGAAAAVRRG
jgi:hypothetical protein